MVQETEQYYMFPIEIVDEQRLYEALNSILLGRELHLIKDIILHFQIVGGKPQKLIIGLKGKPVPVKAAAKLIVQLGGARCSGQALQL